jgi:D-glycero-alpha-D-manno-heptose-7-phosphate kinase
VAVIRARAPLRLGLAGGGTDVSPYCDHHGGYVLNSAIDRYAYAVIETLKEPWVRLSATDQQSEVFTSAETALSLDGKLDLHKAVYNHMIRNFNGGRPIPVALTTFCDAPPGSGLGSSSTLVVAMIRAFSELLNLPLDDYTIAKMAYQIERVDCGLQGGRQDQYSATFGGFNFMEFYADDRVVINPLRIKNWIICELESSLVLYFTGVSRDSANIVTEQSNNVRDGVVKAVEAMHGIKREALAMKECLLRGDFPGIIESMRVGWENKKRSAATVSNPNIDQIYEVAVNGGALAGKVSGAGGGGFMWFFVPAEKRMDVIRALTRFGGHISNCHFTKHGSQAWRTI